eukprot:8715411-Pyramimonas_sp.AAC.1
METSNGTKNVVIFGLSANPPTGLRGHSGIVKRLAEEFDEVLYHGDDAIKSCVDKPVTLTANGKNCQQP